MLGVFWREMGGRWVGFEFVIWFLDDLVSGIWFEDVN